MQQLYGYGTIEVSALQNSLGISFDDYFASERKYLEELIDQGLVEETPGEIHLTSPLGRLLVRVVAAVFDRYLPEDAYRVGLPPHLSSKVG
jgi:oxygen-independent coproporphyrinogen-3 oxidase